jgi:uncharacterized membrane protein
MTDDYFLHRFPLSSLVAATALFLLTHFVSSTPLRGALVKAMGEWPYRWAGLRWLPVVMMPFAFVLIACGYWRNPTMVGADKLLKSDDPARGIIRVTRHPLMWGIMLWAGAHVLARGDVKSAIFFGGFLLLAGLGTLLIDYRKQANPDWSRFAAVTSNLPFLAIAQGRNRIAWGEIGWLRPVIGLAVFAAFFAAHAWLFGARPY